MWLAGHAVTAPPHPPLITAPGITQCQRSLSDWILNLCRILGMCWETLLEYVRRTSERQGGSPCLSRVFFRSIDTPQMLLLQILFYGINDCCMFGSSSLLPLFPLSWSFSYKDSPLKPILCHSELLLQVPGLGSA